MAILKANIVNEFYTKATTDPGSKCVKQSLLCLQILTVLEQIGKQILERSSHGVN